MTIDPKNLTNDHTGDKPSVIKGFIDKHWKLIALVSGVIFLFLLISPGTWFLWGLPSTVLFFETKLGLDQGVSTVFAIVFMFVYAIALPVAGLWMAWPLRSAANRAWALSALLFIFASKPLMFSLFSSPFTPAGEAQKCYFRQDGKIVLSVMSSEGCRVDTKTGEVTRPVTPSVMRAYNRQGMPIELLDPTDENIEFFDSATGEALVWYEWSATNGYTLSSVPGFNPASGAVLTPVTPGIVAAIQQDNLRRQIEQRARAMPNPSRASGSAIINQNNGPQPRSERCTGSRCPENDRRRAVPSTVSVERRPSLPVFVYKAEGATASPTNSEKMRPPSVLDTPNKGE